MLNSFQSSALRGFIQSQLLARNRFASGGKFQLAAITLSPFWSKQPSSYFFQWPGHGSPMNCQPYLKYSFEEDIWPGGNPFGVNHWRRTYTVNRPGGLVTTSDEGTEFPGNYVCWLYQNLFTIPNITINEETDSILDFDYSYDGVSGAGHVRIVLSDAYTQDLITEDLLGLIANDDIDAIPYPGDGQVTYIAKTYAEDDSIIDYNELGKYGPISCWNPYVSWATDSLDIFHPIIAPADPEAVLFFLGGFMNYIDTNTPLQLAYQWRPILCRSRWKSGASPCAVLKADYTADPRIIHCLDHPTDIPNIGDDTWQGPVVGHTFNPDAAGELKINYSLDTTGANPVAQQLIYLPLLDQTALPPGVTDQAFTLP